MTKAKISQYDAVAGNNTDVNGVNIAEGCPPSSMNNMGREIMAALKRYQVGSDGDGVTVGGNLVVSGTATVTSGSINGTTVGATTPATGSFTTLNTSGQVVFNDAGANVDFRVEGDTDANLLFVDASTDRIGIGTSSPGAFVAMGKSSNSGSGGTFPRLTIANTLATQGDGSTTFNFSDLNISSGNGAVNMFLATSFAAGVWEPSGQLNVATNHPFIFKTNNTERMRIDSGGALLVATTASPSASVRGVRISTNGPDGMQISISNTIAGAFDGNVIFINANGQVGSINTNASATTYATSSDYRLKENIQPMQNALEKVQLLKPCTFTWKVDNTLGQGFIAHELQEVCPDAVSGKKDATKIEQVEVSPAVPATYDDEGNELTPAIEAVYEEREVPAYQGVDTSFLVATLTAAIQELSAKNDALEARIAALEAK